MDQQQWDSLAAAIRACKNQAGTLHYEWHAGLSTEISKYANANVGAATQPLEDSYRMKKDEVDGAIDNWITNLKELEKRVWATHADITLAGALHSPEAYEKPNKQLYDRFVQEKKLFARGHVAMDSYREGFPRWNDPPIDRIKALYDLAMQAVAEFEHIPTAFITFPHQLIDPQVFNGFYGLPWSDLYHNSTLQPLLRERLPYFRAQVVRTYEFRSGPSPSPDPFSRAGVLFIYRRPSVG